LIDFGPVEPWQPPRLFTPTMKKRSVSSGTAGADDVVPPAELPVGFVDFVRIGMAGDVVVAGKRVADQDGVRGVGVQRAVGFVHQVVGRQLRAAAQWQRLVEMRELGGDQANAPW
jgi:hypothetical protein